MKQKLNTELPGYYATLAHIYGYSEYSASDGYYLKDNVPMTGGITITNCGLTDYHHDFISGAKWLRPVFHYFFSENEVRNYNDNLFDAILCLIQHGYTIVAIEVESSVNEKVIQLHTEQRGKDKMIYQPFTFIEWKELPHFRCNLHQDTFDDFIAKSDSELLNKAVSEKNFTLFNYDAVDKNHDQPFDYWEIFLPLERVRAIGFAKI